MQTNCCRPALFKIESVRFQPQNFDRQFNGGCEVKLLFQVAPNIDGSAVFIGGALSNFDVC